MSRLLFRRYLLPFSPWALAIPAVVIALGTVFAVALGGGVSPAAATTSSQPPEPTVGRPVVPDTTPEFGADPAGVASENTGAHRSAAARSRGDALSLTFLGDIMAHTVNFSMAEYDHIYADVRAELQSDDVTFANLETPVVSSRPRASYPRFNVHPDYVIAAARSGVDAVSAANNHSNDWGADGIAETREALALLGASHGLAASGLRASAEEPVRATLIEAAGRRIGFVAVTQLHNLPGAGSSLVYSVDYRDEREAQRFLDWVTIRSLGFDLFVVSYHGGIEYAREPHPEKARFFERLARAGADVVWSHHPHVVQPWGKIERRDGSVALVLHSTGNFISGQTWRLGPADAATARAHTGDSPLFRVHARWDVDGRLRLDHVPILAANYRDPRHGMVVRRLDALIRSDIHGDWKRYYVVRRNALREVAWRSGEWHVAAGEDSIRSGAGGAALD